MKFEGDSDQNFFVVTGMHRSHTSLLSRTLARCGMPFHQRMVGADPSNPYGHFEDVELMEWHKDVLRKNGANWFRNVDQTLAVGTRLQQANQVLIEKRYRQLGSSWAFKVPDAALLLDFWGRRPDARFIFIFREPQAVLNSLLRRIGRQIYYRIDVPILFQRAYAVYNESIARFCENNSERSLLIHSADLLSDPKRTVAKAKMIGADLDPRKADQFLVDQKLINAKPRKLEHFLATWLSHERRLASAYERLLRLYNAQEAAFAAGFAHRLPSQSSQGGQRTPIEL